MSPHENRSLTAPEREMLAQAVLRPSDTSLNTPFLFDVSGCGAERLCRAVTRVMESHPSLHSVIVDFTAMARILRDVGDAYGDPGMTPGTGTAPPRADRGDPHARPRRTPAAPPRAERGDPRARPRRTPAAPPRADRVAGAEDYYRRLVRDRSEGLDNGLVPGRRPDAPLPGRVAVWRPGRRWSQALDTLAFTHRVAPVTAVLACVAEAVRALGISVSKDADGYCFELDIADALSESDPEAILRAVFERALRSRREEPEARLRDLPRDELSHRLPSAVPVERTIPEIVREAARRFGPSTALSDERRRVTYDGLIDAVDRMAVAAEAEGLGRPSRVRLIAFEQATMLQEVQASSVLALHRKFFADCGIEADTTMLPASTEQDVLTGEIVRACEDESFHGVTILLPAPDTIDMAVAINTIEPAKEIEGMRWDNISAYLPGSPDEPRLPLIIIDVIRTVIAAAPAPVEPDAQWVIVVDRPAMRRNLITKVLAHVGPGQVWPRDADIRFIPSDSEVLPQTCRAADVLLVAAEQNPGVITSGCVKPGAVVDFSASLVAVHEEKDGTRRPVYQGAVRPEAAENVASLSCPAPRGCGPLLLAGPARNAVLAAVASGRDRG